MFVKYNPVIHNLCRTYKSSVCVCVCSVWVGGTWVCPWEAVLSLDGRGRQGPPLLFNHHTHRSPHCWTCFLLSPHTPHSGKPQTHMLTLLTSVLWNSSLLCSSKCWQKSLVCKCVCVWENHKIAHDCEMLQYHFFSWGWVYSVVIGWIKLSSADSQIHFQQAHYPLKVFLKSFTF